MIVEFGERRPQRDRLVERRDRIVMVTEILQDAAEAVGDIRVVRRQRVRPLAAGKGLLIAAQPAQRDALQTKHAGLVRLLSQRKIEMPDRLAVVLRLETQQAGRVCGFDMRRLELQHLFVSEHGFVTAILRFQHLAELVTRDRHSPAQAAARDQRPARLRRSGPAVATGCRAAASSPARRA